MGHQKNKIYAHTKDDAEANEWQTLDAHLSNVADLTSSFSAAFGAPELGKVIGKCHDVGKADTRWQSYLRNDGSGIDHMIAGGILASQHTPELASLPILGHHGGLKSLAEAKSILKNARHNTHIQAAIERADIDIPEIRILPTFLQSGEDSAMRRKCEFFVRMLFSSLVDADFLDTEQFMTPEKAVARDSEHSLNQLASKFESSQSQLGSETEINATRSRIYETVTQKAEAPPGFFSLSIPTGGGKTRTAMGFALKHALAHDLDRIIVVIPYTSIITQTAQVYRDIFGEEAVVEHHSSVNPDEESQWNRLAAENWDAPVIVTTSVQFFDSLHARKPSRCRKLHNIAKSVVILDEVQTLPPRLLHPILDTMKQLKENYRVSFVFSTATQPAFRDRKGFCGLKNVRELAPEAHEQFEKFQRVTYQLPENRNTQKWDEIADDIRDQKQVLAILNTKQDAKELFEHLPEEATFHLSSSMYPAHRHSVLQTIHERLDKGNECRLISTQVVEAGVDIDFPVVYRAFGPLDSIVQAAGRCNREANLEEGRTVVFYPEDGGMPPGVYKTAADVTQTLMPELDSKDLYSPDLFQDYFARLYTVQNLDQENILQLRSDFDYPKTADRFRLIKSDTYPVIIPHGKGAKLLNEMRYKEHMSRRDFRRIQNNSVMLWSYRLEEALEKGLCAKVREGLFEWTGKYDDKLGVLMDRVDPADLIC